jgi:anti-anti-sigma regulatory factor
MSTMEPIQAHIAYELVDDVEPAVVAIEFRSPEICDPHLAHELGAQLESLIRPELPRDFVIDFANVRSLGSTAFGEIVSFARRVGGVHVCNLHPSLELGAALIGLDDCAECASNRRKAIQAARRAGVGHQDGRAGEPSFID